MGLPRVCFIGLDNLTVLAPEFEHNRIGGEEVQQTLLAKALARRGYSTSMVVGDYGQQDGAVWDAVRAYKAHSADEGIPVLRFVHPRWTKLCAALRRANADVYYLSCASARVGQVALWARRNQRRIIFRIASDTDCEPDRLLVPTWRDRKLYEYGLRRADCILAQSVKQQELLQKNYRLESSVARLLVDTPASVAGFHERDVAMLWVSNIRQLKRPDLFLELARRLPEYCASMVGGTQTGALVLYEQIRAQAPGYSNLTFYGALPYRSTARVFDRAKVFVNTSEIEGFPNSYLQAWIRGVPVVAFLDPDGIIEREGLGRAVRNLDEMTAAVRALAGDPQAWQDSSARCRAYMARHYGEDQILGPYLAAIDHTTRDDPRERHSIASA
jgi:glycosyltransferase involved in cell wall biosynthesis